VSVLYELIKHGDNSVIKLNHNYSVVLRYLR